MGLFLAIIGVVAIVWAVLHVAKADRSDDDSITTEWETDDDTGSGGSDSGGGDGGD